MVQDIEYVDGLIFSNGTWEDYQYWQEAGNTFFEEKTIIRHLPEYESTSGVAPSPECQITNR